MSTARIIPPKVRLELSLDTASILAGLLHVVETKNGSSAAESLFWLWKSLVDAGVPVAKLHVEGELEIKGDEL